MTAALRPALSLLQRDLLRFIRQRNRVVTLLLSPVLLWFVLASGLGRSIQLPTAPRALSFAQFALPGLLVLAVLFATLHSAISLLEDRLQGALQAPLVAPIASSGLLASKIVSSTCLALLQACLLLLLSPLAGIPLDWNRALHTILVLALIAAGFAGLGLAVAWPMRSLQGYHALVNIVVLPLWLLSGAIVPLEPAPAVSWLVWINPVRHAVEATRAALCPPMLLPLDTPPLMQSLAALALFAAITFAAAHACFRNLLRFPA